MNTTSLLGALVAMAPAPEGAPHKEEAFAVQILMMGAIFLVFYFLLIRPQNKRSRELKEMQTTLGKGDRVVTTGGMIGSVHKVTDDIITLEVADGVRVKFQSSAIHERISADTPKKSGKE